MDARTEWSYEDDWSENGNKSGSGVNDCEVYHSQKYMNIAMIAASMGTISMLASVAVIVVIVILKKYNIFVQRLILYLCIACALNSASIVLRFGRAAYESQDTNKNIQDLCIAAAFIDQTTLWSVSIAYVCLTFNMLITVVFKASVQSIEIGYVFAIFLFPLMFNWIPFLQNTYGEAGAWCWIRTRDSHFDHMAKHLIANCSTHELGVYLTYVLWYVPHYVILCAMLVIYIVVVAKLIINTRHWRGLYSMESMHQKERMKELVVPILFYPLIFFILNLFPLINRVYDSFHPPKYILWLLHAVFSPLQGGFVAVLYALDRDTIHRLSPKEFLAYLLHRKTPIQEYPARRGVTDSFENLLPDEYKEDIEVDFTKDSRYGSLAATPNKLKDSQTVLENDNKV